MRCVVQRCARAQVSVDGEVVGSVGRGFMVLCGVEDGDSAADMEYCRGKIAGLRVFEDEAGKMNLSLKDVGGEILLVSQFTLLGDARHGRRPSFSNAAAPEKADALYRELMAETLPKLRRLRRSDLSASERALIEDQICQDERQATGCAKAPYVCAFVRALLEGDEKVLLFAHHHKVMDVYKKELKGYHPVFITGRENDAQKDAALHAFMDGRTNLCVISLRSASGLNLQRATCVVFGELDWSPAVHSQAEDRAHRIGQQDSLLCYYLVSPRGSDRDMQDALGLKVSQFVSLMGDAAPDPDESFMQQQEAREYMRRLVERLQEGGE